MPLQRHIVMRGIFLETALGRPGDDLLSQVLRHSTIGAEEFNDRVRDGIGFRLLAMATRPAKGSFFSCNLDLSFQSHTTQCVGWKRVMRINKPIELLVLVSFMHRCTSTPSLSTWWSSTTLKGEMVSRWVSRLDAFSGYPDRT